MERERKDIGRQIAVLAATGFMLVAAMVGTGAFGGTPVQDLQDGALDVDGSYLAPARPAFAIWSVIYAGLIGYAVWQALPGRRADPRQRSAGPWIAATMVLNGLWLVTAQFLTLGLTVLMIVVLLAALALTFRRLVTTGPGRGVAEAVLVDGVTGLHLGWVTLATVANTAAWLTRAGGDAWPGDPAVWGVGVLVAVAAIGIALPAASGRLAPSLALAWGLSWLGVARVTGSPASPIIGWTAVVVAALVLAAGIAFAVRRRPRAGGRTPAADVRAR